MCVGVENFLHQPDRKRRGDERAAAEAHDRHTGGHARTVREPFDQGRNRRDVTKPESNAAEHAIAEINDPQHVQIDADRGDDEAARPAKARRKHSAPRPAVLDPAPEHRRRRAQKEDRDGEDPAEISQLPVVRRRMIDADQLAHRQVEYAERVSLPNAQMDAQRGRRHHPSAEAGLGDGVRAVEKAEKSRRASGRCWRWSSRALLSEAAACRRSSRAQSNRK